MQHKEIKVWDIFVRVFHWGLVLTFIIAYLTEDELLTLHVYAGYALTGLIALRLVWGFIGSRYARFSEFTYRPSQIKSFLKDTALMRAKRYIGHNPAGGAMILLMLVSLIITSITGIAVYGAEEAAGPLAMMAQSLAPFEDFLEETHEIFANFTLLLVFIHIGGVVVESLLHGENLAKAMVTGRKRA